MFVVFVLYVFYVIFQMLQSYSERHKLLMFVDLHVHSRKFNAFLYGNENVQQGDQHMRLFTWCMQKYCDVFAVKDTVFHISASKEATGRVCFVRSVF